MNLDTVLIFSIFLGYVIRKKMNLDTVFIFSIFLGYVIRKKMNLDTVLQSLIVSSQKKGLMESNIVKQLVK